MLKKGVTALSIWVGINIILAILILSSGLVFKTNSPLTVMTSVKATKSVLVGSFDTLALLYHASSAALSLLVWLTIHNCLAAGQKWVFWALLIGTAFVEGVAAVAFAPSGNAGWPDNILLPILYFAGSSPLNIFLARR